MTTTAKKKHYLNNENLIKELKLSHEKGQMTNNLVKMFYELIERIQRKLYYIKENSQEDCKAHAMMVIVENWHKFDMSYPNPFAYFTRVVFNGLSQGWNRNESNNGNIHISLDAFINNDGDKME